MEHGRDPSIPERKDDAVKGTLTLMFPILVKYRNQSQQASPMVEAIALLDVAPLASITAVVFMDMAMLPPLLEEQFLGLLYHGLSRVWQVVITNTKIGLS